MEPEVRSVKAIMTVDGRYKISNVVDTLCDIDNRCQWDTSVNVSKVIKKYNRNLLTYYYILKIPVPFMSDREFLEKRVVFCWEEGVYIYNTSVADSFYPSSDDLIRGSTVFSGSHVKREGKNIVIRTVSQMDFKVSMPTFFIGGKIADGSATFSKQLANRLSDLK